MHGKLSRNEEATPPTRYSSQKMEKRKEMGTERFSLEKMDALATSLSRAGGGGKEKGKQKISWLHPAHLASLGRSNAVLLILM